MPAPPTSPRRRSSRPCRRPTTSRASRPKTRWPACPTRQDIATEQPDLDLFHPWAITSEQAAALALRCEAAALSTDKRITNSEGAGVSAQQSHFFSAHTHGFRGGYASSRH